MLASVARTRAGALTAQRTLRSQLRIDQLADLPEHLRAPLPIEQKAVTGRPPRASQGEGIDYAPSSWFAGSDRLTELYRKCTLSPVAVANKLLRAAEELEGAGCGPMYEVHRALVQASAEASLERYKKNAPLSPLDGVPVAVKEQMSVQGHAVRMGTRFLPTEKATTDATIIARLKAAGAIVLGTTHMTEFGMTPTGANPMRKMPRNPHHPDYLAGGSSTGSGVAVATGLVPLAIGADGGGSIRIPASINGVFGIKPTWGRVSRAGDPSGGSVAHLGPLGSSTLELARMLECCAARDSADPETREAPEPSNYVAALRRGVRGLVLGVPKSEWADASAEVGQAGMEALRVLERAGAELRDLSIPLAKHAPSIGYITIALEARTNLRQSWNEHADDMSPDLIISFAALDAFSALEFADAQRLRAGLRRDLAKHFESIDALMLPTTQNTAIFANTEDMNTGFLDSPALDSLCRFNFLGNLTGLPALSAPVGADRRGLPIGLQVIGDAFDEATTLAISATLEHAGGAVPKRPATSTDALML